MAGGPQDGDHLQGLWPVGQQVSHVIHTGLQVDKHPSTRDRRQTCHRRRIAAGVALPGIQSGCPSPAPGCRCSTVSKCWTMSLAIVSESAFFMLYAVPFRQHGMKEVTRRVL